MKWVHKLWSQTHLSLSLFLSPLSVVSGSSLQKMNGDINTAISSPSLLPLSLISSQMVLGKNVSSAWVNLELKITLNYDFCHAYLLRCFFCSQIFLEQTTENSNWTCHHSMFRENPKKKTFKQYFLFSFQWKYPCWLLTQNLKTFSYHQAPWSLQPKNIFKSKICLNFLSNVAENYRRFSW